MVACLLLEAPGENLSKVPVEGLCREEDTHFSIPYNHLFRPYILSSMEMNIFFVIHSAFLIQESVLAFFQYFCLTFIDRHSYML